MYAVTCHPDNTELLKTLLSSNSSTSLNTTPNTVSIGPIWNHPIHFTWNVSTKQSSAASVSTQTDNNFSIQHYNYCYAFRTYSRSEEMSSYQRSRNNSSNRSKRQMIYRYHQSQQNECTHGTWYFYYEQLCPLKRPVQPSRKVFPIWCQQNHHLVCQLFPKKNSNLSDKTKTHSPAGSKKHHLQVFYDLSSLKDSPYIVLRKLLSNL